MPAAASKQFGDSCVLYERYNIAQEMGVRFGKDGARTFSLREKSNVPLLLTVCERPQLQFELIYQFHRLRSGGYRSVGPVFCRLASPYAGNAKRAGGKLGAFGCRR